MDNQEFTPVQHVGQISFNNMMGVDFGPLEGRASAANMVAAIAVKKGVYDCYKGIDPATGKVSAIMVVHPDYASEELTTEELYGNAIVGLSGMVGFFCSPKKEYSMKQLGNYINELLSDHPSGERGWHILNTRQFMAPSGRMPGSEVSLHIHRDANDEIDALKIEFDHLAQRNPEEAALKIEGGETNA